MECPSLELTESLGSRGHVWYIVTKEVAETQEFLKTSDIRRWFHLGNSFDAL